MYNGPYSQAKSLYLKHGDNFGEAVEWMQENGALISLPNTFLMGYFCNSAEPEKPLEYDEADCCFVVLCVGDPVAALEQLVELVEYTAYAREFRGDKRVRVIPTEKLYYQL